VYRPIASTSTGAGSGEPIVANDTPAHMAKNRRVEIFVAERAASE
jgi:flagellar motor protein MotB